MGTYVFSTEDRDRRSEVAFSDVKDAFLHYMGQYNHGRKVVLLGHSQGADMVVRLLKAVFDQDPSTSPRHDSTAPSGSTWPTSSLPWGI
jgi:hypothetical protein